MGWASQIALRSIRVYVTVKITSGAKHRRNKTAELISSSSRDAFRKMLVSVVENGKVEGKVTHTFEFCKNAVANSEFWPRITGGATNVYIVSDIKVDDTFKAFYEFCAANDIPVVVVSRYRNNLVVSPCCTFIPPQRYGAYHPRSPAQTPR